MGRRSGLEVIAGACGYHREEQVGRDPWEGQKPGMHLLRHSRGSADSDCNSQWQQRWQRCASVRQLDEEGASLMTIMPIPGQPGDCWLHAGPHTRLWQLTQLRPPLLLRPLNTALAFWYIFFWP